MVLYTPEIHELILAAVAADRAAVLKPRDFGRWLAAHLAHDSQPSTLARVLHGQRFDFGPLSCVFDVNKVDVVWIKWVCLCRVEI